MARMMDAYRAALRRRQVTRHKEGCPSCGCKHLIRAKTAEGRAVACRNCGKIIEHLTNTK